MPDLDISKGLGLLALAGREEGYRNKGGGGEKLTPDREALLLRVYCVAGSGRGSLSTQRSEGGLQFLLVVYTVRTFCLGGGRPNPDIRPLTLPY